MADVELAIVAGQGIATIMARRGISAGAIGAALDVEALEGPGWRDGSGLTLVATAPGTWLALRGDAPHGWAKQLGAALRGLASISDQSDAYIVTRIGGADARTLLQRGAAIDLHPDTFGTGASAMTQIGHIAVLIRQLDLRPTYEILTPRSYARSFEAWLEAALAAL